MNFSAPKKSFFAAANGFCGFRSYFNEIFDPYDFLRIFVIKGGPGTGKSSLMKSICTNFEKRGYETEAVFCSSDASSLDGVIINSKKGKVGILDGTAPHETDAKLPGAIDEILDLGNLLNKKKLEKQRSEICELVREKKKHYNDAYEYLKIAGELFTLTQRHLLKSFLRIDIKVFLDIISNITTINSGRNERIELFSSFGKSGYYKFNLKDYEFKNNISVSGNYGSEYLFMRNLLAFARVNSLSYIRYPAPYSDELTDGIYFIDNDTLVAIGDDFDKKINSFEFVCEKSFKESRDILKCHFDEFNKYLERSKNEFSSASKNHFELEKIYSSAMNFNVISDIQEDLIEKIFELTS